MGTKDVSAAGGAVGQGDDAVHVDRGLAVEERDVADEGSDFDLLVDGDDAEHFFVFVEPREAGVVESADGSEVCGLDVVVGGELGESGVGLVARFKDDGEIALAIGVVEEFDLHAGSGAVGTGFGGGEVLRGLGGGSERDEKAGNGEGRFHAGGSRIQNARFCGKVRGETSGAEAQSSCCVLRHA